MPQLRILSSDNLDDVQEFQNCMIEEPDASLIAAGLAAGHGFALFAESIRVEVVRSLTGA